MSVVGGQGSHTGWAGRCVVAGLAALVALPASALAQDAGGLGGGSLGGGSLGGGGSLLDSGPPQPGDLGGSGLGGGTNPLQSNASLRDRVAAALGLAQPPGGAGGPAISFTPAVTLQQSWTDNALNGPPPTQSAGITTLIPSLAVSVDTQRLVGSLTYSPSIIRYEPSLGQDQIAQNLNGTLHATLLEETLFLDLNAFAGQQTLAGGLGPAGTVAVNAAQAVQDYGFTATPYLMHRFGSFGVGELGGTLAETAQTVPGGLAITTLPGLPPQYISNETTTSTEEHIAFASGDAFGRWLSNARVSLSQFTGTGVLGGSYSNVASYEAGYAISHSLTLLGTIGWEAIHYGGVPPININDMLWNVGAQWTPNPDSSITVRYGRSQGITAAYVNASYAPTARTQLTANYSVALSTDQQQIAAATISNPLNNPSSPAVGTPLAGSSLGPSTNFLGLLSGVYKLETAIVTASLLYDRDTFQATLNRTRQTPVNEIAAGQVAYASLGTFGTLSWQHDLSDALNLTLYGQYGVLGQSTSGAAVNSDVLVVSAVANYAISPTLSLQFLVSRTESSMPAPFLGVTADLVTLGLTKSF